MQIPEAQLQRTLGQIEAKLDELIRREDNRDSAAILLTNRVTSLENWRAYISGAVAILAFVIALGYKILMDLK